MGHKISIKAYADLETLTAITKRATRLRLNLISIIVILASSSVPDGVIYDRSQNTLVFFTIRPRWRYGVARKQLFTTNTKVLIMPTGG
jgi:hypothetical protein